MSWSNALSLHFSFPKFDQFGFWHLAFCICLMDFRPSGTLTHFTTVTQTKNPLAVSQWVSQGNCARIRSWSEPRISQKSWQHDQVLQTEQTLSASFTTPVTSAISHMSWQSKRRVQIKKWQFIKLEGNDSLT